MGVAADVICIAVACLDASVHLHVCAHVSIMHHINVFVYVGVVYSTRP